MQVAHAKGRKVALTLSDAFCVDRHRAEFKELAENAADVVFANEGEIKSLWQVGSFDEAARLCLSHADRIWAVTRSEKGSVVIGNGAVTPVPAEAVARVVDTTGAGDLYASGFLLALAHGRPLADCARLGHICAAEIISHVGARPDTDLAALAKAELG